MFSGFIWKGQNPRIKLSTLELPKEKGGTSLPCLESYFKAAQHRYLHYTHTMLQNGKIRIKAK